jgi:transcriptional regulator with XRE-family HTH domain
MGVIKQGLFEEIAANVHGTREAARLSQEQLAKKAGISLDTVRKAESGRHSHRLNTMVKLADAMGVEVEKLLG